MQDVGGHGGLNLVDGRPGMGARRGGLGARDGDRRVGSCAPEGSSALPFIGNGEGKGRLSMAQQGEGHPVQLGKGAHWWPAGHGVMASSGACGGAWRLLEVPGRTGFGRNRGRAGWFGRGNDAWPARWPAPAYRRHP